MLPISVQINVNFELYLKIKRNKFLKIYKRKKNVFKNKLKIGMKTQQTNEDDQ